MSPDGIRSVAVIGAGTMGHGIAYVSALSGRAVRLHDADPAALDRARARILANAETGVSRGKLDPADRDRIRNEVRCETDFARAVGGADLVIEAIVENLEAKQDLFARVEPLAGPGAMLASNTSSLSVTRIASRLEHPERFLGLHFFNPVHLMALLEIVVHAGTSPETLERARVFGRSLGKEPIVVKDSPGFASSRLGVVLGLEAMRMLEEGVASAEDIDKAMELGYRHPMGPLRLTDLVGLDVRLAIAETLHRELGAEQYRAPKILRDKVAAGELGQKSGRGFYPWPA